MRIKPCGSMIWLIVGTITILGNPTHQYQGTILPITPSVILHGTGLLEGHRTGQQWWQKSNDDWTTKSQNRQIMPILPLQYLHIFALILHSAIHHMCLPLAGNILGICPKHILVLVPTAVEKRSTPASQALGQSFLAMVFRLNDWQQKIRPLLYLDSPNPPKKVKRPKPWGKNTILILGGPV